MKEQILEIFEGYSRFDGISKLLRAGQYDQIAKDIESLAMEFTKRQVDPLKEEEMRKLIRIARHGYHESNGDNTYWCFDIDKESDVIKEYLNSK